ncbi:hypothetical protein HDV06_006482 [Boothiomyces sp. JEL0866]|nr:hypothetical protein HDV06_006471 [Boothiomyces sp. JEL0866]KAJ3324589.1 hypothetical protein HDV06_006482 [Boothiomyces sp. JEL0866]
MITRKRNSKKRKNEISASWYVGYAEDEESVEAIMKKFKELEDFQNESNIREEDGLTTEQLEEVFKRTSAFTLKSARLDEEYNALEIFRYENGIDEEWNEEDDYQIADDAFWDSLLGQKPKGKKKKEKPEKVEKEKPSLLAKYKVMSVQVQDRTGNYFCLKKRVPIADPNLPTYIRIPAAPLSRSWARIIQQKTETILENYRLIRADILNFDLEQLGNDFQAVYMDPPFLLEDEIPREGRITMEQFVIGFKT